MTYSILVKPSLFLEISAGRTNLGFPKSILGVFFVFVENLCNHKSKIRTKNFKNYISVSTTVNYRNWLDLGLFIYTKFKNIPDEHKKLRRNEKTIRSSDSVATLLMLSLPPLIIVISRKINCQCFCFQVSK